MPDLTSGQVMQVQLWICVVMAGWMATSALAARPGSETPSGRSRWITGALLLISVVASVHYFHLSRQPTWSHRWDLFHSLMAARYFDEVGYFGLYDCAVVVDRETHGHYADVSKIRDLRTLAAIPVGRVFAEKRCADAFTAERKAAFAEDLRFFDSIVPRGRWARLLGDKGYNGTPFQTWTIQRIAGSVELTRGTLLAFGWIDLALLATALLCVFRTFGSRACLLALIFFCVNFPNRFVHMGGSILRFDYVAYLVMSVCAIRSERHATAGVLMALATMGRAFPALFLVGYAVKACYEGIRARSIDRRHVRLLAAAAGTLAVGFLLTLTLRNGIEVWTDFADNLRLHTKNTAGFRIGLEHLFMLGGSLTGSDGFLSYPLKTELFESVRIWYAASAGLLLLVVLRLVRKLDEADFTIVFGLLAFFVSSVATRYYYSVLVLPFLFGPELRRERGFPLACLALFAMSAVAYRVNLADDFAPFLYNTLFSSMLAAYFVGLLLWLTLRDRSGTVDRRWVAIRRSPDVMALALVVLLVATGGTLSRLGSDAGTGPPEERRSSTSSAPGLDDADRVAIAEIVARAAAGRSPALPSTLPGALRRGPALVYAALRSAGVQVGAGWGAGESWAQAIVEAVFIARREARSPVDTVELVLAHGFEAVDPAARKARLSNVHRGVRGIEVDIGGQTVRLSPTQMLASNRSFTRELERIAERRGESLERMLEAARLGTFEGAQLLVSLGDTPRAVEMFRGNRVVEYAEVTRPAAEAMVRRMEDWMLRQVGDDGRMEYKYWPSRGEYSRSNNMIRQWMASRVLVRIARRRGDAELVELAERNIRYNLDRFYREDGELGLIEYEGKIKLGALALAALAMLEHPEADEFAPQIAALRRTTESMWRADGSFVTFLEPAGRTDGQNFYPGEALLLWAVLLEEDGTAELARRFRISRDHYRRWHLAQRNPAFVPWHTQAYARRYARTGEADLLDWILEMNDWLLEMQTRSRVVYDDTEGRFFDPQRPFGPPHASSTGAYLEGLIEAYRLAASIGDSARVQRYRRAILGGVRSSMQLEFADEIDMFYVSRRDAVRGGLRTTVYDNEIRVDNVQHTLSALYDILATFHDTDFALTPPR